MTVRNLSILYILFLLSTAGQAQDKYYTKSGKIEFSSRASLEDIDAKNKTVSVLLDSKTGMLQFSVLLKSFEFEKALMEEHFNSDYVESDKYPKAEFKGTITNNATVNYNKDGTYQVKIKGLLTLHGISKNLETNATIIVIGPKLEANATFTILLSDYNIRVPSMAKDKVARKIKISVDCKLDPLK
jgi:polyisoprenoid-binding protein YceI